MVNSQRKMHTNSSSNGANNVVGFLRSLSTLQWALMLSVVLHVIPLTIRFVNPTAYQRVFKDTPLEVILVNANAQEAPEKAQAIAQTNMAGGGDADEGRASNPMPATDADAQGDSDADATQKIETLNQQQTQLLSTIKEQIALLPPPAPDAPSLNPETVQQEEKRKQLSKLLGEIERRISQENTRPKKRYISPATKEEVYAVYYDQLRQRIENQGTNSFPQINGKKIYGELTMVLTVNYDGRILSAEIVLPSGQRMLDKQAMAIARSAAPFGEFNAAMRSKADQIVLVSKFNFTRDAGLKTNLSTSTPDLP